MTPPVTAPGLRQRSAQADTMTNSIRATAGRISHGRRHGFPSRPCLHRESSQCSRDGPVAVHERVLRCEIASQSAKEIRYPAMLSVASLNRSAVSATFRGPGGFVCACLQITEQAVCSDTLSQPEPVCSLRDLRRTHRRRRRVHGLSRRAAAVRWTRAVSTWRRAVSRRARPSAPTDSSADPHLLNPEELGLQPVDVLLRLGQDRRRELARPVVAELHAQLDEGVVRARRRSSPASGRSRTVPSRRSPPG